MKGGKRAKKNKMTRTAVLAPKTKSVTAKNPTKKAPAKPTDPPPQSTKSKKSYWDTLPPGRSLVDEGKQKK